MSDKHQLRVSRIVGVLTWPWRKLRDIELSGRVIWSLIAVDAALLGMWLFAINGYIFHRPLDQDDYSVVICVTVLCYAACLLYGLRPGRPQWQWILKAAAGQIVAAAVLHVFFPKLGMNLSERQVIKFFATEFPVLVLTRLAYLACRRTLPRARLECVRLTLLAGAGLFLFGGRLVSSAGTVSGDSYWYCVMTSDFVSQWRAGIFPVFAGQSEYAFNGAVSPVRFAPALQHMAGIADLLTGRSLPFPTLQNLALAIFAFAGIYSAYFCIAAILPRRRWMAATFAMLYAASPGVMAMIYQGDLLLSITTIPFVPVAIYGLWRTLRDNGRAPIAWTVLPVAAAWYCHPPIALWLTFIAMGVHASIGFSRWRDPSLYAWWGRGIALFALAGSYPFVSIAALRLPRTGSSVDVIIQGIRDSFPGTVLPVTNDSKDIGNYQLGWTLWGLLVLVSLVWMIRPRRSEGLLLAMAGGLLILLFPVPWLNEALWRTIPQFVRDITYHAPMERFNVILAAISVIVAAGAVAMWDRRGLVWTLAFAAILGVGAAWSLQEAASFIYRDFIAGLPPPSPGPDPLLDLNNVVLTRYAYGAFPAVPPYFSHGYVDPYLENRVLAPDQKTVLASNVAAVSATNAAKEIALTAVYDGDRTVTVSPRFSIVPGVRYAAHLDLSSPPSTSGTLVVSGDTTMRQYFLPDSSLGMVHAVPTRSFGTTPTSRDFFPLWSTAAQPETFAIRYVLDSRLSETPSVDFGRLTLQPYSVDNLPIHIVSWMPYRAEAVTEAEGSWLETPRLFVPGYAGTVNGQPAEISKSSGGLVAVRLHAGKNDVVLRCPGTWPLRASYWITLLTWTGVIALLIRRAVRHWPRPLVTA